MGYRFKTKSINKKKIILAAGSCLRLCPRPAHGVSLRKYMCPHLCHWSHFGGKVIKEQSHTIISSLSFPIFADFECHRILEMKENSDVN